MFLEASDDLVEVTVTEADASNDILNNPNRIRIPAAAKELTPGNKKEEKKKKPAPKFYPNCFVLFKDPSTEKGPFFRWMTKEDVGALPDIFMTENALTEDQRLKPVDLQFNGKAWDGHVLFRIDKGKRQKP